MEVKHTPGPWAVGYRGLDIVCVNEKIGGTAKLFDVRGWGYLTGHGHGALGLDAATAEKIQKANATLAAAAPDLLQHLKDRCADLRASLDCVGFEWDRDQRVCAELEYAASMELIAKADGTP